MTAVSENFFLSRYQSPLGEYVIATSQRGVVYVATAAEALTRLNRWRQDGIQLKDGVELNRAAASELERYFSGRLRQFNVPLDLRGTPFQRQVWERLRDIPYGETRTYGRLAQELGRPKAARAIGGAVGSNHVAILVPCHRIVGVKGQLVGYGGGLERKKALLELEATAYRKGVS